MGVLFGDRRSLKSPLAPAELLQVLRKNTSEPWAHWPSPGPNPLEGEVSDQGFKVRRTAWSRNAWRPWVEGTIEEVAGGSGAEAKIDLGGFAAVYTWLWLTAAVVVAVVILVLKHSPMALGLAAVGYSVAELAYRYEVARTLGVMKDLVGLQ